MQENVSFETKNFFVADRQGQVPKDTKTMSIRSRLQAPPTQSTTQNPNLIPRAPLAPVNQHGRFQNVNVNNAAELRTRLVVPTEAPVLMTSAPTTTSTVPAFVPNDNPAKIVEEVNVLPAAVVEQPVPKPT